MKQLGGDEGADGVPWDDDDFFNILDGYDELPPEDQEKIRKALKQGHVDDEDWKGVSFHDHTTCMMFQPTSSRTRILIVREREASTSVLRRRKLLRMRKPTGDLTPHP